ncbi:MAG TPA: hypothetical protein VF163_16360 [Micromonosporaceae bacterium]
MVTFDYAPNPTFMEAAARFIKRPEVRAMVRSTPVLVTLIVCGTVLGAAFLAVVGLLLWYGRDAGALLDFVQTALMIVMARHMQQIRRNGNGIPKP